MSLPDNVFKVLFDEAQFGLALCTMSNEDGSGGEMVAVNRAFADLIGRTVGETISELKISYWNITPEEYRECELEQIKLLRSTGKYGPYAKEYIHKKGHTVPVQLWGCLVKYGDISYIWSCVWQIQNPIQLAVFDDAPYALALTYFDEKTQAYDTGDFVFVNKEFARIIGYTVDEVLAPKKTSYWDLTPEEYGEQELQQIDRLRNDQCYGTPVPYRKHYIHKDGEYVEVALHGRVTMIRDRKYVWSIIEEGEKKVPTLPSKPVTHSKRPSAGDRLHEKAIASKIARSRAIQPRDDLS